MEYHFSSPLTAYFIIIWALAILLEHMHKKFEINQAKIKGSCQSGRKVVTHNSKSDLPLFPKHFAANVAKNYFCCIVWSWSGVPWPQYPKPQTFNPPWALLYSNFECFTKTWSKLLNRFHPNRHRSSLKTYAKWLLELHFEHARSHKPMAQSS